MLYFFAINDILLIGSRETVPVVPNVLISARGVICRSRSFLILYSKQRKLIFYMFELSFLCQLSL